VTELSDYKRLVEAPMISSYEARIRSLSDEIQRLRDALSEVELAKMPGQARAIAAQTLRPAPTEAQLIIARELVREKPSTSYIQRKMGLGYNHATRIMERLEAEGLVSAPASNGMRSIQQKTNETQK